MPKFKPLPQSQLTNNSPEKTIVLHYTTKDSDRDYSIEENDFEQNSSILNLNEYRRIPCVYGSLGFMFRNLKGRAYTVVNAVRFGLNQHTHKEDSKRLLNLIEFFDDLDIDSQNRVDVLDILCRKFKVQPYILVDIFEKSLNYFAQKTLNISLNANKGQLVDFTTQEALKKNNFKYTELMFKTNKLVETEPLVNINEGDVNITNNNLNVDMGVLGNIQKDINKQLRKNDLDDNLLNENNNEIKQITDGTQDYIDVDVENVNEKELINA
jgi:hypothetical protein